jgi:hypothetical protein
MIAKMNGVDPENAAVLMFVGATVLVAVTVGVYVSVEGKVFSAVGVAVDAMVAELIP